jgi:hypothetical protein
MKSRENQQFKIYLKGSEFKTSPEKDQQVLEKALERFRRNKQEMNSVSLWRLIMKSSITRVAAVLLLIAGIGFISWRGLDNQSNDQRSPLTFLSILNTACAAEQTLFTGDHVVHIIHEITLYPNTDGPDIKEQLEELIDSNFSLNKADALIRAWSSSYGWLPVHSLGPDGEFRWHKMEFTGTADEASTIQEHIWYDPETGFFAREFRQFEQVLFAISFDGDAVYLTQAGDDGRFEVQREPITERFSLPDNPAEFLGISASFQGSMDLMNLPPIEEESLEQLSDGTWLRVYKLHWPGTDAYHVFSVDDYDNTIEQIESVAYERPVMQTQRIYTESVDVLDISWDLAELDGETMQAQSEVEFKEGATRITAQQMADRALVETYVFGRFPDWIVEQVFVETLEEASQLGRMFIVLCRAADGRHVMLIQGSPLDQYFKAAFNMNKQSGSQWAPRIFDSNRFKMHILPEMRYLPNSIGTQAMSNWSKGVLFKDSGFEPSENARMYVLHSPTNTDFAMVINGKVSDEELEVLVGGMVPAKLYIDESGQALEWYLETDPGCVTYYEFEPGAFMKDWLVLGSIPVFDDDLSFSDKFNDGQTQVLALEEDPFDIHQFEPTVYIDGKEYHWELYCSPSELVDLAWPLGQQNFANAYAFAQIEMSQETPVLLAIGDDDRIRVWLNGELVHEDTEGGHLVPDKAFVPVTLRKGINQLLLKVQNGITEWQFTFRIFPADYNPLDGKMEPELSSVTYDGLIPGEFMKDWLLLGPAPANDGEPNWVESKAAFDMDHLESYEHFEPTVQIDNKDYAWSVYRSYTGILDIHRAWPQGPKEVSEYVFAYAWAQVDMPKETTALLGIGSDDAVKVWLNGELVHEKWVHRGAFPDHDRIKVTFRKGANQLVFKIQNGFGRWKFCCRLLE